MLNNSQKNNQGQSKAIAFNWWLEICTANPAYIYYFGDFLSFDEATQAQHGFLEDLEAEGAKILSIEIKQCQPQQLTICLSEEDINYKIANKSNSNFIFNGFDLDIFNRNLSNTFKPLNLKNKIY